MTRFTRDDDLRGATFEGVDLRGARFVEADLSGIVVRGSDIDGADIDAPWLTGDSTLTINGVDVVPLVEAELDRRFPGRSQRRAHDLDGLRAAWRAVERAWEAVLARAAALTPGAVDESVDGEWSLAQTLRHLVMATDVWLGGAILRRPQPFHPLGLAFAGAAEDDAFDESVFSARTPTYDEVLEARAGRQTMVRDFLTGATPEQLDEPRANPWAPERTSTVRSCLHVVLKEEWDHLRFAVRDLDVMRDGSPAGGSPRPG